MGRSLYRLYLYLVSTAALLFAAVGANSLLSALFAFTALRGTSRGAPTHQELVQSTVLAVVLWVIAGVLGGVHYWLIRRDLRSDPAAGGGGIRAFFLNFVEAGAVVTAFSAAAAAFTTLAYSAPYGGYDASGQVALALSALGVAAVLEWERRRTRTAPGVARVFERLHLYGVPLIVVVFSGIGTWQSAIRESVGALLFRAGQYPLCPSPLTKPGSVDYPTGPCYGAPNLALLWSAAVVLALVWAGYILLARGDTGSGLRQVLHLIGFTIGLIFSLVGVVLGLQLGIRGLMGTPIVPTDLVTSYDFLSPLLVGVAVLAAYGLWLRAEAATLPMGAPAAVLTVEAVAAGVLSVPFWWGAGLALHNAVERAVATVPPSTNDWAMAWALLLTGLASVPLVLDLQRRTAQTGISGPHRGLVLGLLAAGAVTAATGAVIALYALGTEVLGAGLDNWQGTARTGVVVLVDGAVVVGLYLWLGLRLRYFRAPQPVAPAAAPDSIEAVLDAYATGRLSRAAATKRILELTHPTPAEQASS
jgi:hypothetical protein